MAAGREQILQGGEQNSTFFYPNFSIVFGPPVSA